MNPYTMDMQDPQSEMVTVSEWTGVNKGITPSNIKTNEMAGAQNIQLIEQGFPDKRWGYKRIFDDSLGNGKINGIYSSLYNGYIVFAWSNGLYKQTGSDDPILFYNSLTNSVGHFFTMSDKLYYKNGYEFVQIDYGFNAIPIQTVAFKPTTVIGASPTGGGTPFEAVNLIGSGRKNSIVSDAVTGTNEVFKVQVTHSATSSGNVAFVFNGTTVNIAVLAGDTIYDVATKIRNCGASGWSITGERDFAIFISTTSGTRTNASYTPSQGVTATITTVIEGSASGQMFYLDTSDIDATPVEIIGNGLSKIENTDFTVYRTLGIIVMNSVIPAPVIGGVDNVIISFNKTIGDVYQVETLHIDSSASASANVTITLNDIPYIIAVGSGDSTSAVATKIRNATYTGWGTSGSTDTVIFTSTSYERLSPATYSKGTTGVNASMVLTTIGSESYSNRILKSTVKPVLYGGDNDTRVFLAYKNVRYYSGLYDATYFPDINYSKVGSDNGNITGFSQLGDTQIVLKERKESEPTIWSSSFYLDSASTPTYPVKPINGMASCDAINSIQIVKNNPTFLDAIGGVSWLTVPDIRDTRIVDGLSDRINSDLLKEANRQNAISFLWGNRYGICMNGNAYVWNFQLNAWYGTWTNINASCFLSMGEDLYFGSSSEGLIYKFVEEYNDDGVAISSWFIMKFFAFGSYFRKKLLSRIYVDLRASVKCSVTVSYTTDAINSPRYLRIIQRDLFSYKSFDYSKFAYSSGFGFPKAFLRKMREKNTIWTQFKFENSNLDESMPIVSTQYEYITQNLVKDN